MRAIQTTWLIGSIGALAACSGPNVDDYRYDCSEDEECGAGWYCGPDHYCLERDTAPCQEQRWDDPRTDDEEDLGLGDTCGLGPCAGGTVICDAHGMLDCSSFTYPRVDRCDGRDEDCDGRTDVTVDGSSVCVEPWEVCDDCIDNDGDGTTDTGGCAWRWPLVVSADAREGFDEGYTVALALDHAALVSGARSTRSGDDVRVVWRNPDGELVDSDRVADPAGGGWNSSSLRLFFTLKAPLPAGAIQESRYFLYTNVPDLPAPADASAVLTKADFFERESSSDVGDPWVEHEQVGAWEIANGALFCASADPDGAGPTAVMPLDLLEAGRWLVHFGFDWGVPQDPDFFVAMQVGDWETFATTPPTLETRGYGAAAALAWFSSPLVSSHWRLAGAQDSDVDLAAPASGRVALDLLLDLERHTAAVHVDGVLSNATVPLASWPISALRIFPAQLGGTLVARNRGFSEVYLRRLATSEQEPLVSMGVPIACP